MLLSSRSPIRREPPNRCCTRIRLMRSVSRLIWQVYCFFFFFFPNCSISHEDIKEPVILVGDSEMKSSRELCFANYDVTHKSYLTFNYKL